MDEAFRSIESARDRQARSESINFTELREEMAWKGLTQEGLDDILKSDD